MILTPVNRYGIVQGMLLALWPRLHPVLVGGWRTYRGVPVDVLGRAMALHAGAAGAAFEALHWDESMALAAPRA